jgi:hypothetical protein
MTDTQIAERRLALAQKDEIACSARGVTGKGARRHG